MIVGGGMVGASLAVALKDSSLQIALIDAAPIVLEDSRLIALNYASYHFFKTIDIWHQLAAQAEKINQIHVSQLGRFGITQISADEIDLDVLGYVVPAKYINAALYSALHNQNNIKLIRPGNVTALHQDADKVTVTVTYAGETITLEAKAVIGADGTQSTVRDLLNIGTDITDYHQSALVTATELQRSHHNIAYERFQKTGAIAMLPLTEQRAATIWTGPTELISRLLKLNDDEFKSELQKQFGYRLGRFNKTEKRVSYPLKMLRAHQYKKQQVVLIGNAAHTLHPVAAQGLNLALYEISALTKYFNKNGTSLDQLPDLSSQQDFSSRLSHQLIRIFSNDFFIMNTARSIGLIGLDIFPGLKKRIMQRAILDVKN